MAAENGCNPVCPYWIETLGELNEPACGRYKTLCSAAIEECRNEPVKRDAKKPGIKSISAWPGSIRGRGPITKRLDSEYREE
jgi:hypothetical protein